MCIREQLQIGSCIAYKNHTHKKIYYIILALHMLLSLSALRLIKWVLLMRYNVAELTRYLPSRIWPLHGACWNSDYYWNLAGAVVCWLRTQWWNTRKHTYFMPKSSDTGCWWLSLAAHAHPGHIFKIEATRDIGFLLIGLSRKREKKKKKWNETHTIHIIRSGELIHHFLQTILCRLLRRQRGKNRHVELAAHNCYNSDVLSKTIWSIGKSWCSICCISVFLTSSGEKKVVTLVRRKGVLVHTCYGIESWIHTDDKVMNVSDRIILTIRWFIFPLWS